jgi:hypothetical protein
VFLLYDDEGGEEGWGDVGTKNKKGERGKKQEKLSLRMLPRR